MKKPDKQKSPDQSSRSRDFVRYTNIAFRMLAIILIGVFGGMKLDEYFEIQGSIFTLILSIVSVIASMVIVIREISATK